MIKHYFKLAYRSFRATKLIWGGSIVTVFLGTLSISLLFSYVYNELSMDGFHHRKDEIFLTVFQASPESQKEYLNAKSFLRFNYKEYLEIENAFSLNKFGKNDINFTIEKTIFSPEGILADSCFFQVFDFKLKVGNPKTILSDPDAAVLSERFAKEMFGDENPIGKIIKTSGKFGKVYTIKGIVENPPSNSSINFDYILPRHSAGINIVGIYFLLAKQGINKEALIQKIENAPLPQGSIYKEGKMSLVSLNDVYFSGIPLGFGSIHSRFGDKESLNILYVTIAILLLISILNFSNLQVININASIKNIGINKISGARVHHIFYQKATEILLLIIISSLLTTAGYHIVLPYFNAISGVSLAPHPLVIWMLNGVVLMLLTGLAMIYPAFVFSHIPMTLSLKNQLFASNKLFGRQAIVVTQFSLSIFLLIASVVVVKQLKLMVDKDLGFNCRNIIKTQLVNDIPFKGEYDKQQLVEQQRNLQFVQNELESNPSILNYTQGSSPIEIFQMPWALKNGKNEYMTQNTLSVSDSSYSQLFGLQLVKGRFFDSHKDNWKTDRIVINEAAMKYWSIEDISQIRLLNKHFRTESGFEIVGVVKNFNYERLSYRPRPLIMLFSDRIARNFFIQFKDGTTKTGLQFIRQLKDKINPGETFQSSMLSDEIVALYQKEKRLSQIYILFTLIAFLISAIGLFTIAIYDTQKRTKEIGIRKVNGAQISEVMNMLNKDFVKWVAIAFVIATPLAYYAMHKWLENFAYKTSLSWWIFALAGLLALGIALLTVSWQSWKAARRNPVESLRYE